MDNSRYIRNILLSDFGEKGQEKLKNSKVLVIGAGGLASPVLMYLAASGIGFLGIMDNDNVDKTNLQRQIIHFEKDENSLKVDSAYQKIIAINSNVKVEKYPFLLLEENAEEIIKKYDFVISASDNFDAKYLVDKYCKKLGIAYSHAGATGWQGQAFTFVEGHKGLTEFFGEKPPIGSYPTAKEIGILGPFVGIMGSIQATECIKYLIGIDNKNLLVDKLLIIDSKTMEINTIKF